MSVALILPTFPQGLIYCSGRLASWADIVAIVIPLGMCQLEGKVWPVGRDVLQPLQEAGQEFFPAAKSLHFGFLSGKLDWVPLAGTSPAINSSSPPPVPNTGLATQ
jgi:hypothetical protein